MTHYHPHATRIGLVLSGLLFAAVGCQDEPLEVFPFPGTTVPTAATDLEPVPGDEGGGGAGGEGGAVPEAPKRPSGPDPIAACCASIQRNMKAAPLAQQGAYLTALGTCQAVRTNPQARTQLAKIRTQLGSLKVPDTCR